MIEPFLEDPEELEQAELLKELEISFTPTSVVKQSTLSEEQKKRLMNFLAGKNDAGVSWDLIKQRRSNGVTQIKEINFKW